MASHRTQLPWMLGTFVAMLLPISANAYMSGSLSALLPLLLPGMMAIPRAYFCIGSLAGTAMLVGVGVLTYFTLAVLVQGSAATGADTFSQLTKMLCGTVVMKVLQVAVLAFCFGFGVVYLVSVKPCVNPAGGPLPCYGREQQQQLQQQQQQLSLYFNMSTHCWASL